MQLEDNVPVQGEIGNEIKREREREREREKEEKR